MSTAVAAAAWRTWMCVVCGFTYHEADGLPFAQAGIRGLVAVLEARRMGEHARDAGEQPVGVGVIRGDQVQAAGRSVGRLHFVAAGECENDSRPRSASPS